jgi:carbohydrate diacid regulator
MIVNQATIEARLPNQREIKNKFIHDLLRGASGDEESLAREGQILGMDLSRPRAVILIDAASYILATKDRDRTLGSEEHAWRCAQRVITTVVGFFSLRDDTICAYIGDGEVAVLKASGAKDLSAWADHPPASDAAGGAAPGLAPLIAFPEPGARAEAPDIASGASWADLGALKRASAALLERLRRETGAPFSIGVGRYHPSICALAASYQDAHAALELGRRLRGPNQAHCLDGLGVAAFVGVADQGAKHDLATHLLSPLDHEVELIETLTAFFAEDCSPSATANRLTIHRNTLSYRLDKISALTGLDPRHFDDAVQIHLALTLRALHELPPRLPLAPRASAAVMPGDGSAAM